MNIDLSLSFFDYSSKYVMVGTSAKKNKMGYQLFVDLIKKGYNIVPFHRSESEIDGCACINSFESLPNTITKAIIITPKSITNVFVELVAQKGIKDIWIQQASETNDTKLLIDKYNLNAVTQKCCYMYATPVEGVHKFHRNVLKFFGQRFN